MESLYVASLAGSRMARRVRRLAAPYCPRPPLLGLTVCKARRCRASLLASASPTHSEPRKASHGQVGEQKHRPSGLAPQANPSRPLPRALPSWASIRDGPTMRRGGWQAAVTDSFHQGLQMLFPSPMCRRQQCASRWTDLRLQSLTSLAPVSQTCLRFAGSCRGRVALLDDNRTRFGQDACVPHLTVAPIKAPRHQARKIACDVLADSPALSRLRDHPKRSA